MTVYDRSSFAAGQDSGTRIAACVARLAALELLDESRWWNRRRHRLMAAALVACAEELEGTADADAGDGAGLRGECHARGLPGQRLRRQGGLLATPGSPAET